MLPVQSARPSDFCREFLGSVFLALRRGMVVFTSKLVQVRAGYFGRLSGRFDKDRAFLGLGFFVEQGTSSLGLILTVAFFGLSSERLVPNFFLLRWRRTVLIVYLDAVASGDRTISSAETSAAGARATLTPASTQAVMSLRETIPMS